MAANSVNSFSPGKYKHFKGETYETFCLALDKAGNQYVLYRPVKTPTHFWIRPYAMFLGKVDYNGTFIPRFEQKTSCPIHKQVETLVQILQKQEIIITHSETNIAYFIPSINKTDTCVTVAPVTATTGGSFLSDYELARRMGYQISKIDDELQIRQRPLFTDPFQLKIGNNNKSIIERHFNPCSIDLQIADSGYLRTRHKNLDITSIVHTATATDLWKPIKIRTKNASKYFVLRPRQTILTHTKECIYIPCDCAGKIEIKSTYARLSLNITSGDFCNPGYRGHFPLEITNWGNHTLILHPGETMAQLMLIPLSGPVIVPYSKKATHINPLGIDDGNPYTFYRERSIKLIRKQSGAQPLITFYEKIHELANEENTNDINGFRERFDNNFLTFCQRNMRKKKFITAVEKPDIRKLCLAYINREKRMKRLFHLPILSSVFSLICTIIAALIPSILEKKIVLNLSPPYLAAIIAFLIIFFASLYYAFRKPKEFCTMEKFDINRILSTITE